MPSGTPHGAEKEATQLRRFVVIGFYYGDEQDRFGHEVYAVDAEQAELQARTSADEQGGRAVIAAVLDDAGKIVR